MHENISLLTHFLRQRFFDDLLQVVEKPSKHKLSSSNALLHHQLHVKSMLTFFSSHVSNSETTMVFEKSTYPSLVLLIF